MSRSTNSFDSYSVSGLNHGIQEDGEIGHRLDHQGDAEWNYDKKFHNGEDINMGTEAVDWPDDNTTYKNVCDALFRDGLVDEDEVNVDVENGIVTLSGIVPDRTARLKAVESIVNVFGVINIINKLTIKPDHGLIGRSDGWPV